MQASYIRLSDFKERLGGALTVVPGQGNDAYWLRKLVQISREWDADTRGNHLYASLATTYYRMEPTTLKRGELVIAPMASITSVAIRDSASESYTALAEDTDYWAEREEMWEEPAPIRKLVVNPNSSLLSTWPGGDPRAIRVIGYRGYSYEVESTGQTVVDNPLTAGATTLTVATGHGIDLGETLVIGTEQVGVVGVPSGSALLLTIERGLNGTTAAEHANGTVVYRRVYPAGITGILGERVRTLVGDDFRGGAASNDFIGSGVMTNQAWPRYRGATGKYALGRGWL